jgi:hypothetical protein
MNTAVIKESKMHRDFLSGTVVSVSEIKRR